MQQELSKVEKTLQFEIQRLELDVASRDQLQSELSKVKQLDKNQTFMLTPLCLSVLYDNTVVLFTRGLQALSCDSLLQLCKSVLSRSRTSIQPDGLGDKALLSLLKLQEVERVVREENAEIGRLEKKAAKAQELR